MGLHRIRGGLVAMLLLVAACDGNDDNNGRAGQAGGTGTGVDNGDNSATQIPTGLSVAIAPSSVVLQPGQTQQFAAVVSGAIDQGVSWEASGGAISDTGLYTAPDRPGVYEVTATSRENPRASGSAKVTVAIRPLEGTWSTLIGGASIDGLRDAVVDAVGNVIVGGAMASEDFPRTPGAYAGAATGGYVAKVSADGRELVFSAIIPELVDSIAVGADGAIYLTGTATVDVPATFGAFDTTPNGGLDCYVAKLSADATQLIYATYLGGSLNELICRIAVDDEGNAYVAGETLSPDFPVTAGAFDTALGDHEDGFVAKLNPSGSALVYATYLGGGVSAVEERLNGIAVDAQGHAVVAGTSAAGDFPATAGAYAQTPNGASGDVVVAKLNASGSGLVFATFAGGSGAEAASEMALDSLGNVYVTGRTASSDFPAAGAFVSKSGGDDAFALKLQADGAALAYATYLGGAGNDTGNVIVVDADRNAYVVGESRLPEGAIAEPNFPVTPGALDTTFNGLTEPLAIDGFLVKLDAAGANLVYGTYVGGSDFDFANTLAVDSRGNAYVCGRTNSPDFPVTPDAFDTTFVGGSLYPEGSDELQRHLFSGDAFVMKLNAAGAL